MSVSVEVWGDYACFSRPEMKVERVSYDVMTPSAARGLLEAIYWHPGMRWVIDRIHVCAPIRFTNIRRNEVKDTVNARKAKTVMEKGGELYLAAPDSIQRPFFGFLRIFVTSFTAPPREKSVCRCGYQPQIPAITPQLLSCWNLAGYR